MKPHNGRFLDFLLPSILDLLDLIAPAQLGKSSYDKMADLVVLGVAGNEEHVPSNSVFEHCFARYAVIAQGQKNPGNVCLNYGIFEGRK